MKNKKNVFGTPPYEKYPNSKTIRAVFSGPKRKPKEPAVCEHNQVDYKAMKNLTLRSFTIIDRLSKAVVMLEERLNAIEKS